MKIRERVKGFISDKLRAPAIRLALRIIRHYGGGNAVRHFRKEAEMAYGTEDAVQWRMVEQVGDVLSLVSLQGHSGLTKEYLLSLVTKSMRFGILSPLTFKDDEFEEYPGGIAQNKRLSRVFRKSDNGGTWYKDIDCLDYFVGLVYDFAKKEITDGYSGIWGGLVYLIDNDGEIYPSTSVGIKNLTGFRGGNNHTVKALKVTGYSRTDRGKSFIVANADALPSEWHEDYEMRPADESLDKEVIDFIAMYDIAGIYERNIGYGNKSV